MRVRLLEADDIANCLSKWPFQGVDAALATAVVERGLVEHRLQGTVIESAATGALLAFGLSGFVAEGNLGSAVQGPSGLVVSLLQAEAAGTQLLLAPSAQRAATRRNELHLVVLTYRQERFDSRDAHSDALLTAGYAAYRLLHEGYPLRGVWQEGDADDEGWLRASGYGLKRRYESDTGAGRILCGLLREEVESQWPSHTVSFLFRQATSEMRLTQAQRRVAQFALWNLTDEQVASRLSISPHTVRQHWRGIFDRVRLSHPGMLGTLLPGEAGEGRGPQKRGHVMNYLRVNLHELRPTT